MIFTLRAVCAGKEVRPVPSEELGQAFAVLAQGEADRVMFDSAFVKDIELMPELLCAGLLLAQLLQQRLPRLGARLVFVLNEPEVPEDLLLPLDRGGVSLINRGHASDLDAGDDDREDDVDPDDDDCEEELGDLPAKMLLLSAHKAHELIRQVFACFCCQPQHSRHFKRMAFMGSRWASRAYPAQRFRCAGVANCIGSNSGGRIFGCERRRVFASTVNVRSWGSSFEPEFW